MCVLLVEKSQIPGVQLLTDNPCLYFVEQMNGKKKDALKPFNFSQAYPDIYPILVVITRLILDENPLSNSK